MLDAVKNKFSTNSNNNINKMQSILESIYIMEGSVEKQKESYNESLLDRQ